MWLQRWDRGAISGEAPQPSLTQFCLSGRHRDIRASVLHLAGRLGGTLAG